MQALTSFLTAHPCRTYLLDTVSAEEQTRWVEAISGAIKGGKEAGPQSEVKAGSQK